MADEYPPQGEPGANPPTWRPAEPHTPTVPDPYPSGPYASVWYPAGPYSAPDQSATGPAAPGGSATVPLPANAVVNTGPPPPLEPGVHVLAQIGEIEVTSSSVRTPVGAAALRGTEWQVQDHWYTTQKTPTWATLCAIFGFFCLTVFSLLFLLAKETVYGGVVQVTVISGRLRYETRVPVASQADVDRVHEAVGYVRSLSTA